MSRVAPQAFNVTETTVDRTGNVLTITDANGANSDDELFIRVDPKGRHPAAHLRRHPPGRRGDHTSRPQHHRRPHRRPRGSTDPRQHPAGDDALELDSTLVDALLANNITLTYDGGTQTTSPPAMS
ncbi:MAG: hypothetical protein R3B90_12410 [Planctomycetaceae bacterium]